ncbi:MAG: translocation/assembly module TamB domain-containing protein [Thiotrichales bacterium]|nr:MAG: translocation/assembly module TamB domain-containing protein [Thiotrichales bacterium]
MTRTIKITALVVLLTTVMAVVALTAVLTWAVRSEQGSRWLLEQGLGFVPVTIQADGISGTLADGLDVESLYIALPAAEIRAEVISFSWSPASLLAGVVNIHSAQINALSVDIMQSESSGEPIDDLLFWLQIPIDIHIESGQLGKLRVEQAEFENLEIAGKIGHGRLHIETLAAQIADVRLKANGELAGPGPGRLVADASWDMPSQNLKGSGSFEGDIETLEFSQLIYMPEVVNFNGTIHDLFKSPSLSGIAEWQRLRLPGETALHANAGRFTINSDFVSARIEGNSTLLLEGWPAAPAQLEALIDLDGITIDSYQIETLDGQVSGLGRIDFGDQLQGRLQIDGTGIDTGLVNSDLPGRVGFDAVLLIESVEELLLDVTRADALMVDRNFSGVARVKLSNGELAAIDASINAGSNRLHATVELGKQLAGTIDLQAPELTMLWPGLVGSADGTVTLSGSPEQPRGRLTAQATSVAYEQQSLETLHFSGEFLPDNRLSGKLAATGLVVAEQQLGDLEASLSGTRSEHQSVLSLSGGVVAVELQASGGWDGEYLSQRFTAGRIQPDGFDPWHLGQNPVLRLAADKGELSEHCWNQGGSGICVATTSWESGSLNSTVAVNDFALASLQPLLQEGYSIDGIVDADLRLVRNAAGLQGELHWRQSRTVLGYSDEIDTFSTVLDEVQIDILSDRNRTSLDAVLNGEDGMNISATAKVSGPLVSESRLEAAAKGRLPSIGLLRPLVQRVVNPGELQGVLTVDLGVTGSLGDPVFTGGAYLADGKLGLAGAGITLSDINLAAESKGTDKLLVTGGLRSGSGHADILGEIRSNEANDLVADIRIQGENLATVRVPDLSVDTSPDLRLRIGDGVFDVSGRLQIPRAVAEIRDLPQGAVPKSADVIVHAPERELERANETIVTLDVELVLGDDVRFRGFGLDSRLDGGLRLRQGKGDNLRTSGTVRVRDGFLTGYGRELRVDRGELTFTGPLDDPLVNIQVSRESVYDGRQYTIGLRLTGSAQNIKTEPFSRPAMSERDVLSFLLLDRPASSDSDATGAAVALGLQQLLPDQSGRFGLDEVSFETNDANEAAMVAGKRINDNLHVRYVFGSLGSPGSFRIRYRLGRGFSLEASTGARQALDLIYLLER